jgi:hypothetical protein
VILLLHAIFASTVGHRRVDPFLHFLGGAAAGYFFYQMLSRWQSSEVMPQLVFSFSLSCTAFLLWEVIEFVSDEFLGTVIQISVAETMTDVILGMAGSLLILTIILIHSRKSN